MSVDSPRTVASPTLLDALIPIGFLMSSLVAALHYFGADASYGPSQIALLVTGCLALLIGMKNGESWRDLERGVYDGMSVVFAPTFILLAVGIMIATWIAGGVVPALIYYGLKVLNPGIFYAAACFVCAIVSLSIGSSWTTAASVGVAMVGIAVGMGLSVEITAGAVVSGAYFGDKMSPLSDTTNLAPAVVGVDLFDHVKHMFWTGAPALVFALIGFLFLGSQVEPSTQIVTLESTLRFLEQNFQIGWYLLMPLLVLFVLAYKRMPALPAILIAALMGLLCAIWFQPRQWVGELPLPAALWQLTVNGYSASTGDAVLDGLLSGGGAASMLNTVWLILCAVFFGGAMERTGLLQALIAGIVKRARSAAALISATVLTCIGTNIVSGDQYIAIVLPGRMYKLAFREAGLAPVNLSRALEDSATVTSPLVPWNTCGAFMAASLGVATLDYLPYCLFNLVMPLISIAYGIFNFRILRLSDGEAAIAASTTL